LPVKCFVGYIAIFLLIVAFILATDISSVVNAQDVIIDRQVNFNIGDCWCSTKYPNLPAGATIQVSWKANLDYGAIGKIFLVAESELKWMHNELYPIQSAHSLTEADIEDGIEGSFCYTLPASGNYYVWIENYAWSHLDLLGPYIRMNYYEVKLLDKTPPEIHIISPENTTYSSSTIPLIFTVNEPVSWIGYSLDKASNITIMGNVTLTNLTEGLHSIIVYANDTSGNMGASNEILFTVQIPPEKFRITIYSSPIEVTFTVNGESHTTPWSWDYDEGTFLTIIMPETYVVNDARYYWNTWNDGNTNRSRSFNVNANITLTAYYTGPYYELTVDSAPITGVTFTLNNTSYMTPFNEWLLKGHYVIEMPETYGAYIWSHWLEDGDANRTKTIFLTEGETWTGIFEYAIPPYGPTAKLTATPERSNVGQKVLFNASASLPGWNGTHTMPITEYRWDFGDGNKTTTTTPIVYHTYQKAGIYYVTLTVYAPGATPETDSTSVRIIVQIPTVGGKCYPIENPTLTTAQPIELSIVTIVTMFMLTMIVRKKKKK